jgi:hypothetical protein
VWVCVRLQQQLVGLQLVLGQWQQVPQHWQPGCPAGRKSSSISISSRVVMRWSVIMMMMHKQGV